MGAATMTMALLPLAGGAAAAPPDPDVIPGSYIVVLDSGDPRSVAAEHSRAHNASVDRVYRHALRGYAAHMSERAAARIAADPRVAYVDADRVVTTAHHLCGHDKPTPYQGDCGGEPAPTTGTIAGTVTTTSGAISGATVTVGGTTLSATSGADGGYAIADVAEGSYTVTASATGYEAQERQATVVAGATSDVDFSLTATATGNDLQPVPWGVARVGAPLRGGNTGGGTHVYVIDTGIDLRHRDLTVSAAGYAAEQCKGGGCAAAWDDDHGHGTHVAGTIGALDNDVDVVGVAPEVTLHAVKVLSNRGSGTRSGVIAGINWVAAHNTGVPRVANMSLGGSGSKTGTCTSSGFSGSDAYHEAICNATRTGVVFAVAAGNSGVDAAGAVPAAYADTVITVSATRASSDWPSWSNWGDQTHSGIPTASAPVGIAAPGVGILSTRAGGGTTTMSGTSMAAPHVAGAVALFLKGTAPPASYSAFSNARADLLGSRAQATSSANGWANTSGKPHVERFLQVTGL